MNDRLPFLNENVPLPHHVAKYEGGVSFRFAMIQDVIHERFSKHSQAYYQARNDLTRQKLANATHDDTTRFPLYDDLGAGLDRLGRSDDAVSVIRAKLAAQMTKGLKDRDLYTSYANLGTFLIHGNFKKASSGDLDAKSRMREGIEFIRKSVEVNPQAHFGREQWQAAIAEFLLATIDRPDLLKTYDCLGNRLGLDIPDILDRETNWVNMPYGRAFDPAFSQGKVDAEVPGFFVEGIDVGAASQWKSLNSIRNHITKIGAETGWENVPVPSHRTPVAFDEPMLGIIGMWRQGGGANPHFALAIGETMLRVGQRYLAWSAFERAGRLASRYSSDQKLQDFLVEHCRKRQSDLEASFRFKPNARPNLRAQSDTEIEYGTNYQKEYQAFETQALRGMSINDPHFYEAFPRKGEDIASKSGPEEIYSRLPREKYAKYGAEQRHALSVFGAGVGALCCVGLLTVKKAKRSLSSTI
jgi:hypothetical protein